MTNYRSPFLKLLAERGYINQISDPEGLDKLALEGPVTAYIGFDATGPSLHVGHMMGIMMLRRLQQAGHKPIVLMGGGTTKVGDPSGKDEARQLLTDEIIGNNIASIKRVFENFLTFGSGPTDAVMVNNAEWLDELKYIPLLRDVGRHFSVNRMLTFDSVKLRLERDQPLSFLEFNYMILQAYDFAELAKTRGVRLQMGGSDQWGNIVNGIDLGRRLHGAGLYGLTCPLLTTASGAKMGKTAQGAVWLNEDMLSGYDFWQYWRNVEDDDVAKFLRLFTDIPLNEIDQLIAGNINDAKKRLATEITSLVRGKAAAEQAAETARKTFEEGALSENLPSVEIASSELEAGIGVLTAFVTAGLVDSNGDARRQIKGGGLKVNDQTVTDDKAVLKTSDLKEGTIKLSLGKKRHILLKPKA
ncbi:tyrosine--tRNA ligase [Terrihabitans soli]|uniref:Tyrosine--tRNA ligase n=1 Tax=Terrihabitans soli TaxID=708113 RepID=A0A6S6QX20_9HYPH|nr:tyrosine--tRNA ligase [Terrihabitans soli]BCJ91088.1 tyrosine--tRNA ligase [Terrihabitans soli]